MGAARRLRGHPARTRPRRAVHGRAFKGLVLKARLHIRRPFDPHLAVQLCRRGVSGALLLCRARGLCAAGAGRHPAERVPRARGHHRHHHAPPRAAPGQVGDAFLEGLRPARRALPLGSADEPAQCVHGRRAGHGEDSAGSHPSRAAQGAARGFAIGARAPARPRAARGPGLRRRRRRRGRAGDAGEKGRRLPAERRVRPGLHRRRGFEDVAGRVGARGGVRRGTGIEPILETESFRGQVKVPIFSRAHPALRASPGKGRRRPELYGPHFKCAFEADVAGVDVLRAGKGRLVRRVSLGAVRRQDAADLGASRRRRRPGGFG
mmetsp:Transcript_19767/g.66857  ORF Transcript_19767/g.66857 Transcript_19767/m.66857 type:complete len:321 (+) Transcript_19767:1661-2623(+)